MNPVNQACGSPLPTSAVPDLAQTARSPNWLCPYWLVTLFRIMAFRRWQVDWEKTEYVSFRGGPCR